MNVQDANFQDLAESYYESTRAKQAAEYLCREIEQKSWRQLATLLRDYRVRAIESEEEIELRAAVDELMITCDVLEICALAGFVGPPQRNGLWQTIEVVLENTQVQQYYSDYYPLKLPELLRYRIQGRHSKIEPDAATLAGSIIQFLALDGKFMRTLNDGYLLRMLDSFQIEGCWFSDVVAVIAKPKEFVRKILLPPEERKVLDEALYEFSQFMQFSMELHRLLESLSNRPLLRSEIWHHYGYWFGIIGSELEEQLGDALDQFLVWKPTKDRPDATVEIQREVSAARAVISNLTSGDYAAPVNKLLRAI